MTARASLPEWSYSGRRRRPSAIGFGPKETKGGPADQVALNIEGVVDGGVGGD